MRFPQAIFGGVLLIAATFSHAALVSTFETGLEGWTWDAGGATVTHSISGGNPGGFLHIEDSATGIGMFVYAPDKFLGNQTSNDGGTLAMDVRLLAGPIIDVESYGTVQLTGSNGLTASRDLIVGPPSAAWSTFAAPLIAAEWGVSQATWTSILSDISRLSVELEVGSNLDASGLDNFSISPIPEPSRYLLFAFGIGTLLMVAKRRGLLTRQ